ncbi:hypothetical protein JNUCC64_12955 [Streptomyces sp. JNUCC 64]
MSQPPEPSPRYLAEVVAEWSSVYGDWDTRMVLGTFTSPYPGRALRWLRRQAVRIADGLDPDPDVGPIHPDALNEIPFPDHEFPGDAPTRLRAWALSGDHSPAIRRLRDGGTVQVVAAEFGERYVLTARPDTVTVTPNLDTVTRNRP